jgi:hypothetical protein
MGMGQSLDNGERSKEPWLHDDLVDDILNEKYGQLEWVLANMDIWIDKLTRFNSL